MTALDPLAPLPARKTGGPLYRQVQQRLTDALAHGHYAPGSVLPNERDLAGQFGVSIGTLRAAVDSLVADGMLVRQQGKGTFVAKHDLDRLRFHFFHIVPHDGVKDGYPGVELIAFARERADATCAEKLRIERGAPVFRIRNRVSLQSEIVSIDDIVLPAQLFSGLTEARVRNRPSTLYALYQSAFGITIAHSAERLRAITCSSEQAKQLAVSARAPVLQIRRVASSYDYTPIEWRLSTVNTARHEYASELMS